MKYLKLFEAFDSKIMSKTLKYLSKDSKDRFFNMMKAYCEKYDFPFSKLNDDFFEYLPYSAALKKYISVGDIVEDCKTKSEDVLDKKIAVAGDVCTKGKLKRTWGTKTRDVECPTCHGTGKIKVGVKADAPEDYELTKIWLDDTGDIVSITYTDGKTPGGISSSSKTELKMENFKQGDRVTRISQLKNLGYIYVVRGRDEAVGYSIVEDGRYYLISNNKDLADSNNDLQPRGDWEKYGKYSWILRHEGSNYYDKIYKMESIYSNDSVNHFAYNKVTTKAKSGWYVKKETPVDFEGLKKAKFAIIFDSGKAKQTEYEKVSDKVSKRTDYKFGAAAFEKPEDIKKQNLDRWITKLASKNVGGKLTDLDSLDTYIFRILAGKNILFKLMNGGVSDLEKVIDNFFTMLEGVEPEEVVTNESLLLEATDTDELRIYEREFTRVLRFLDARGERGIARDMEEYYEETFEYILDEGNFSKKRAMIMAIRYTFEEFDYGLSSMGFKFSGKSDKPKETTTAPTTTKVKKVEDKTKPVRELLYSLFKKSFTDNEKLNNEIKAFMDNTTIRWNDKLILKKASEVSNLIYGKLKSYGKVSTLSDAELVLQKIKSIESIFKSPRWEFNKLGYKDVKSYSKKLDDTQKDKVISSLDELSKLIEKI